MMHFPIFPMPVFAIHNLPTAFLERRRCHEHASASDLSCQVIHSPILEAQDINRATHLARPLAKVPTPDRQVVRTGSQLLQHWRPRRPSLLKLSPIKCWMPWRIFLILEKLHFAKAFDVMRYSVDNLITD